MTAAWISTVEFTLQSLLAGREAATHCPSLVGTNHYQPREIVRMEFLWICKCEATYLREPRLKRYFISNGTTLTLAHTVTHTNKLCEQWCWFEASELRGEGEGGGNMRTAINSVGAKLLIQVLWWLVEITLTKMDWGLQIYEQRSNKDRVMYDIASYTFRNVPNSQFYNSRDESRIFSYLNFCKIFLFAIFHIISVRCFLRSKFKFFACERMSIKTFVHTCVKPQKWKFSNGRNFFLGIYSINFQILSIATPS